jgi:hypothetical protein
MKNKKTILLIIFLLTISVVFIFLPHADARIVCTKTEKNNLKNKAYKTNLSYIFVTTEKGDHYFQIVIDNIPEGIEVRMGGSTLGKGSEKKKIVIDQYHSSGEEIVIDFYSEYGEACVGQKLYTKRLTLPKYNSYSEREECIEYEEFELCNKWYKGNIPDDEYFITKLNDYIYHRNEKNTREDPIDKQENNSNILTYVVVFVAVVATGVLAYQIKYRTKHRKIKKELSESNKDKIITDNDVNKNINPMVLNHNIGTNNNKHNNNNKNQK